MKYTYLLLILSIFACQTTEKQENVEKEQQPKTVIEKWQPYDETEEIAQNATYESSRMHYKLIQSKVLDKNEIWKNVAPQISDFSEEEYQKLKPLILEQNIPTIQKHIEEGNLSYQKLVQWYLYRIVKFENNRETSLHTIISINPDAVAQAIEKDKSRANKKHEIFGMPILLKDNINFDKLPTTAGAVALQNNIAPNAFIVNQIQEKGGIILGKVNLSEWANYLHDNGPNGYSAIGGQTLNPYGRKQFDTGGSSAGSGTAVAANYAVAAVGTETAGSILSPSSSNSIVGLKPTIGLLSRGGIVPISSMLDTPGPMTKNITDNAILLSAMTGEDAKDEATKGQTKQLNYAENLDKYLKGMRFGANKAFMEDSLYISMIEKFKSLGAEVVEFSFDEMKFDNFLQLLNADMKRDLPLYFQNYVGESISFISTKDIVEYNNQDTTIRIPYAQARFDGIVADQTTDEELENLKRAMNAEAINLFEKPMKELNLDCILSINNWNAAEAALAKYPCLTLPMGYRNSGQPAGLTLIARPFEEQKLLQIGFAIEKATKSRKVPKGYE
ncbi:amidase family protein [Bernardetia sp.]|uniref:amidase family protein n=1 Tax=Bernardetia sp. TaxID=1937974 RepID=UPI0025BA5032|nr:amidase family protein [Bernardetia sp.]